MQPKKYWQIINETFHSLMKQDKRIMIWGQGVLSPWYVGGICLGLFDKFPGRIIDTPVSESAIAGATVGLALAGMRPIMIFPRHDFVLYAMDAIINHAAKLRYIFGGSVSVPLVFYLIQNKGGSQGAQHSQDFSWIFKNIPGLKWVDPQTPDDAGRALMVAVEDDNPVIFFDDRARYEKEVSLPENIIIERSGKINENPGCPVPCSEILEEAYFEQL